MPAAASIIVHNHPSALQGAWTGGKPRLATACFWAHRTVAMHVSAYELPRISIPRTSVNKGKKKGPRRSRPRSFAPRAPAVAFSRLGPGLQIGEAEVRLEPEEPPQHVAEGTE